MFISSTGLRDTRKTFLALPIVVMGILVLLTPFDARATAILDQSCCGTTNLVVTFLANQTRAQTLTAALAGQLTGIDLGLGLTSGSLPTFEIFAGAFTAGQPVAAFGSPLATLVLNDTGVSLPNSVSGTFFFADLSSAGIFVVPGQQFSIVQRPPAIPFGGAWFGTSGNPYPGGIGLTSSGLPPDNLMTFGPPPGGTLDLFFRTYVESPATAPEPVSLLLIDSV